MKEGKVFTPNLIVSKMLNEINFKEKYIGKKILEPSCGDGNFAEEIVKQIITFSKSVKEDLENVYFVELDEVEVNKLKKRLDLIIGNINWKIYNSDFLFDFKEKDFDLIIGNPPYIRIHDLNKSYKEKLINNFDSCKFGMTDIYYAFIEKSLSILKEKGELSFIVPNAFITTVSAKKIRELLKTKIYSIYNFESEKVFPDTGTYTLIFSAINDNIETITYKTKKNSTVKKNKDLEDELWSFFNKEESEEKEKLIAKTGIATLLDKAYVFKYYETNDTEYIFFSTILKKKIVIEKNIVKTAIKASKSINDKYYEKIIYPYDSYGEIIFEKEIEKKFPKCYSYFLEIKDYLLRRSNLDKAKWYGFGRTQGLKNQNCLKIIVPTMIKEKNFFIANENEVIYSGYFIPIENENEIERIDNKKTFNYLFNTAKDIGSGWKTVTKGIIENAIN